LNKRFFRINFCLSEKAEEVLKELKNEGFEVFETEILDVFVVFEKNQKISSSKMYLEGKIYIQDISSQLPMKFLNLKRDGFHLDISASPGSKTTQGSSILQNSGVIIANDPTKNRFLKLLENLNFQHTKNVLPISIRGETFSDFFQNFFDTAIADPPCSSLGRSCSLKWFPKKSKILAITQEKILKNAFLSLKNGGEMIYSTCTIRPEENEAVIENFLRKFSDKCELVDLREDFKKIINKKIFLQSQDDNNEKVSSFYYDENIKSYLKEHFLEDFSQKRERYKKIRDEIWEKTLTIQNLGEGFFIAKIKKIKETFSSKPEKKIFCKIENFEKNPTHSIFFFNGKGVKIENALWRILEKRFENRNVGR